MDYTCNIVLCQLERQNLTFLFGQVNITFRQVKNSVKLVSGQVKKIHISTPL